MDFKNILGKLDSIESNKNVTESRKTTGGMKDILTKLDTLSSKNAGKKKKALTEGVAIQADGADAMQLLLRLSGMDIDAANLDSNSGAPNFGDPLSNKDVVDTSTAMSTPSPEGPDEVGAVGVTFATSDTVDEPVSDYSDDEDDEDETREEEGDDEYANTPDENEVQDTEDQMNQGDDLNKKKKQYPDAEDGDNPMKAFESEMSNLIDDLISEGKIKAEDDDDDIDETSCADKKKKMKVKESVKLNKEYNTLLESILNNAGIKRI